MSVAKPRAARFRVGEWVTLLFGPRPIIAQILEDRGPIGVQQRRLYRIRPLGQDESMAFELSEEQLEAAPLPNKGSLVDYLQNGGLLDILRSNLTGGKDAPKVWFTSRPQGHVVHTFELGGATVPFLSLHNNRIFAPRKDDVMDFLANFGLSRADAERIVNAVGSAP